jgi:hypothetical protein
VEVSVSLSSAAHLNPQHDSLRQVASRFGCSGSSAETMPATAARPCRPLGSARVSAETMPAAAAMKPYPR